MCYHCCEACLDTAFQAIVDAEPEIDYDVAMDRAVDARAEREHPCNEHA